MPAAANFVHEISGSGGAGPLALESVIGRRRFSEAFSLGGTDAFDIFASSRTSNEWQRGTGHLSDADTIVWDTVSQSSNGGNPVDFTPGIIDLTNFIPAGKIVQTDLAQTLTNKTLTSPVINSPTGITKGDVGLGNVDNTADADKPVSAATQTALDAKANSADLAAVATSGDSADVAFAPAGNIAASNVSAALTELDSEKIATSVLDTDGTLAANSDLKVATQKAVKTYADQLIAANDAMVFKGVIDCSSNPNYPAADRGHTYKVSVAGKIGGASGIVVEAGDLILCITDGTSAGNQATVGANWVVSQTKIDGAVTGPASSTSGNFPSFNGTSGKIIQDSGKAVPSGAVVGTTDTQTLQNKTLDNTNAATIQDANFTLQDDGDTTKQFKFQLSGIATATTRTWTVPNSSDTFVGKATTDTLTNKTLTDPALTGMTAGSALFYDGSKVTQDNANFFWDDSNNRLGVGTSAPQTKFTASANSGTPQAPQFNETIQAAGADGASMGILLDAYGGAGCNAQFVGRRAFGTAASPSTINAADTPLLQFGGAGYGASGYSSSYRAMIQFRTAAAWSSGSEGAYIDFQTNPIGSAALAARRMRIDDKGSIVIGTAAIATNATDGFLYVPTCAGTPTGTPTSYTGAAPIVVNTTNNKLYFYSGGAWRDAGP